MHSVANHYCYSHFLLWEMSLMTCAEKLIEPTQSRSSVNLARYVCNDYSTGTSGCVKGMVNKLQWESLSTIVETTYSLCCTDWSMYIQTATYNKVTDEQEGNIVSTKKELEVSLQPSSQEQSSISANTSWRDSGQTLTVCHPVCSY